MRFFVATILLAGVCACVSATTRATPAASDRPIVVFVHGRGQFGMDSSSLRREWEADLDSSLGPAGVPLLRDGDVRLAWYADALDPHTSNDCSVTMSQAGTVDVDARDVLTGFLGLITEALGDSARPLRGMFGEVLYFLDGRTRCAAEHRVGDVIEGALREHRPVVVIAYSLGSLVAYGYLSSARADSLAGRIRLITVGSPLALEPVRELVFGDRDATLRVPRAVASWDNVYDADDILSGPLAPNLPVNAVRDLETHARTPDDAHALTRYLRDPAMGGALKHALSRLP